MMLRGRANGLPLLAKELVEQAARPRTFIIRGIYAFLLCSLTILLFYTEVYRTALGPLDILGKGPVLFSQLFRLQTAGVYLFLPALMSGVIASEKERSTLSLLLLTRLRPWSIIFEKYLSRLIAMGSFLLLSIPVLAFCTAIGGLSATEVIVGFWTLFLMTLQVGAVSIACSSWCRTTTQAFIATYVVLGLLFVVFPFFHALTHETAFPVVANVLITFMNSAAIMVALVIRALSYVIWTIPDSAGQPPNFFYDPSFIPTYFTPNGGAGASDEFPSLPLNPFTLREIFNPTLLNQFSSSSPQVFARIAGLSVPILMSVAAFLGVARYALIRRAVLQPRNWLLKVFRSLDGVFQKLNQNKLTRGIVLTREQTTLPVYDAITWRETQRKSLGTIRYLVRVLLVLEFPALFVCSLVLAFDQQGPRGWTAVSVVTLLFWIIAALFLASRSAALIAGERQHESLDVLLSTPLWCRDIVQQKMNGVRRLMFVVATPIATCVLTQILWEATTNIGGWSRWGDSWNDGWLLYALVAVPSLFIQLPMISWIGLYFSLRMRSTTRAIMATLSVVFGMAGLAMLTIPLSDFSKPFALIAWAMLPPSAVIISEMGRLSATASFLWIPIIFIHAMIFLKVRTYVLNKASGLLDRSELTE